MKITPLEIRQKTFEKAFRGLDKDEVTAFLMTLSQEWEKILDENKELKIKLEASQNEVSKLREVESSLFKTLKTAEDTGANMVEQANKTAELHLKEAQMQAEALMNEAKSKSKSLIEESESVAKQTLDNMEEEIRSLVQAYKTIENVRDNLLDDLKRTATDALDKMQRASEKVKPFNFEALLNKARKQFEANRPDPVKAPEIKEPAPLEDIPTDDKKEVKSEKDTSEEKAIEDEIENNDTTLDIDDVDDNENDGLEVDAERTDPINQVKEEIREDKMAKENDETEEVIIAPEDQEDTAQSVVESVNPVQQEIPDPIENQPEETAVETPEIKNQPESDQEKPKTKSFFDEI